MDTKLCACCGKEFAKPATESRAMWENRHRFCSRSCARQGHEAWSKGLTAEEDSRLAASREHKLQGHRDRGERVEKVCPICQTAFECERSQTSLRVTCGDEACKTIYRKTVTGRKISEALRAGYAGGRAPVGWTTRGPSEAEKALAAVLVPLGWTAEYRIKDHSHKRGQPAICDLALVESKLDVEVDGSSHRNKSKHDTERDAVLRFLGWRVLRLKDIDVLADVEKTANAVRCWAGGDR